MPTPQRRWPQNAEFARRSTEELARDARPLLEKALEEVKRNPDLARANIALGLVALSDIQRLMSEAKHGTPAPNTTAPDASAPEADSGR